MIPVFIIIFPLQYVEGEGRNPCFQHLAGTSAFLICDSRRARGWPAQKTQAWNLGQLEPSPLHLHSGPTHPASELRLMYRGMRSKWSTGPTLATLAPWSIF